MQKVIFSHNLATDLQAAYSACEHDKTFILCDNTTKEKCLPLILSNISPAIQPIVITIPAGDDNKTINSLTHVWQSLSHGGATRHSLLINVAGGMVTDLGGFAAATFKRGINFINIPTTLLAQVDASVGGKTGINFCGYKNEIGSFCDASTVIISSEFLRTLDLQNVLSGYAEMLKHALLKDDEMLHEHLTFDFSNINYLHIQKMVEQSIQVKQNVVEQDPKENGLRKALNLGHTFAHAFESHYFKKNEETAKSDTASVEMPLLHGYAVAWGLVCELFLSSIKTNFPTEKLHQVAAFIKENYGTPNINCNDYPELLELMTHDKKNTAGTINFTLLSNTGNIHINQTATKPEIEDAFDFLIF